MADSDSSSFGLVKSSYDDVNSALENLLSNVSGTGSVTTAQVNQAITTAINNATANLIKSAAVDTTNNGVAEMGVTKAGVPWFNDSNGATDYLLTTSFGGASLPVGTVLPYSSSDVPTGYLLCNGASYDTNMYVALYAKLKQNTVPDMRGMFLRGLDTTGSVDNVSPVRKLLSFEEGSYIMGEWSADYTSFNNIQAGYSTRLAGMQALGWDVAANQTLQFSAAHNPGEGDMAATSSAQSGYEVAGVTRPKNIAVNYIIKAV